MPDLAATIEAAAPAAAAAAWATPRIGSRIGGWLHRQPQRRLVREYSDGPCGETSHLRLRQRPSQCPGCHNMALRWTRSRGWYCPNCRTENISAAFEAPGSPYDALREPDPPHPMDSILPALRWAYSDHAAGKISSDILVLLIENAEWVAWAAQQPRQTMPVFYPSRQAVEADSGALARKQQIEGFCANYRGPVDAYVAQRVEYLKRQYPR